MWKILVLGMEKGERSLVREKGVPRTGKGIRFGEVFLRSLNVLEHLGDSVC